MLTIKYFKHWVKQIIKRNFICFYFKKCGHWKIYIHGLHCIPIGRHESRMCGLEYAVKIGSLGGVDRASVGHHESRMCGLEYAINIGSLGGVDYA